MPKKIDWSKPIRRTAKAGAITQLTYLCILQNDSDYRHLLKVGYGMSGTEAEQTMLLDDTGRGRHDPFPLVENVPEQTERFYNIYPDSGHTTAQSARDSAHGLRVGVVKVVLQDNKVVSAEVVE